MFKKGWNFIKENVATIITVATTLLTSVYAALRLCIFMYWKGYFTRLNIDISIMNTNFDKSIFTVILVLIIGLIVVIFMRWTYEILNTIKNKKSKKQLAGFKKISTILGKFMLGFVLSILVLSLANISLTILITSIIKMYSYISTFIFLYCIEMMIILIELITINNEKTSKNRKIEMILMEILAYSLLSLAILFYGGSHSIDNKNEVRLVENEEYMITYCDGPHYVLHKVEYDKNKIIIHKNEQKIISVDNCEIYIKNINDISIID